MDRTSEIGKKIIAVTLATCVLFPEHKLAASAVTAIALIILIVGQRTLDRKYEYDITAYMYLISQGETEMALAEIQDFAYACPHYDPNQCLCRKRCPDCQYGHK